MRKLLVIVLCASMLFMLVACDDSTTKEKVSDANDGAADEVDDGVVDEVDDEVADDEGEEKTFRLGYSAPELSAEFNARVQQELQEACDAEGIELITLSAESDVNTQVTQIENLITMGVDAMVVFPVDPVVVGDVMKQAKDAGIFVLNVDQISDPENYDVAISVSMSDLGVVCNEMASAWIDENFPDAEPGTVKCAVIGVWITEQFAARCDVMLDIASYNEKAVVVSQYDIMSDYATEITQNTSILLQQHPDINVIFTFTDIFSMVADEVIMQQADTIDVSKIAQFTVDWSAAGLEMIKASQTDESTLRGTAATNITIAADIMDIVMGRYDESDLNEDNVIMGKITPVTYANVDEFLSELE